MWSTSCTIACMEAEIKLLSTRTLHPAQFPHTRIAVPSAAASAPCAPARPQTACNRCARDATGQHTRTHRAATPPGCGVIWYVRNSQLCSTAAPPLSARRAAGTQTPAHAAPNRPLPAGWGGHGCWQSGLGLHLADRAFHAGRVQTQAVVLKPGCAAVQHSLSARVLAGRARPPQAFRLSEAGAAPTSSHSGLAPGLKLHALIVSRARAGPRPPEGCRHTKTNASGPCESCPAVYEAVHVSQCPVSLSRTPLTCKALRRCVC
jgi:hypothetical protein